jgi:hypothetical protein
MPGSERVPAGLRDTCAEGSEEAIKNWAEVLAPKFGADESEVEQFLRGLKIECELPDRHTIATVQIDSVMRPALRQLGIDDRDAARLFSPGQGSCS